MVRAQYRVWCVRCFDCRLLSWNIHRCPAMDRRYMPGEYSVALVMRKPSVLTRTCQIGDILQTVAANPSSTVHSIPSLLRSPDIILKLVLLSFLSLAPILGRDYLRAWISPRSLTHVEGETDNPEKDERHFRWVSEWRSKIRLPSKSRSRSGSESHGDFEKLS